MVLCTKCPTLLALPLIAVAALWMHRARRVGDGTAVSPITIDTSATYTLVGVASGKCVDVPNGSTSTGGQLDIATASARPGSSSSWTRRGAATTTCATWAAAYAWTSTPRRRRTGRRSSSGTCGTASNQQWLFTDSSGAETATVHHSGKLLDVSNGSTADGTKLQQWTATSGTNQLFKLQVVNTAYTWKNVAIA